MDKRRSIAECSWLATTLVCVVACSEGTAPVSVDGSPDAVIGGFPAEGEELDAIGVIAVAYFNQIVPRPPRLNCTGTLIDPDTVVTAKHCIDEYSSLEPETTKLVFQIGSDGRAPKQSIPIVSFEGAPGDTGGYSGFGHDVAVLQLSAPVTGIKPVKWAALTEELLGEDFVSIGYGISDSNGSAGVRLLGKGRLDALQGRTYEAIFGSFESYFEARYGIDPAECLGMNAPNGGDPDDVYDPCSFLSDANRHYQNELLETAHEAFVSVPEGGAQTCYGDSGGPLLRSDEEGNLVSYGVLTGIGAESDLQECDYGSLYATFNDDDVMAFVEQSEAWVDPCQALVDGPVCEGSVVKRCSSFAEGKRRLLSFDCANTGLTCTKLRDGKFGCGATPAP